MRQGGPVEGQYNIFFSRRIYMKMEFSSQGREMLLFFITNMAAVTSHANNQFLQFGFLTSQEVKLNHTRSPLVDVPTFSLCYKDHPLQSKCICFARQTGFGYRNHLFGSRQKKIKNPRKYLSLNHATVLNKIKQEALKQAANAENIIQLHYHLEAHVPL